MDIKTNLYDKKKFDNNLVALRKSWNVYIRFQYRTDPRVPL